MKNTTILKKVLAGMLSATLSITALTLPASAAWKTTENGKQWIQSDGTAAKSKWLTTKSGAKYYIKSNGYMATGLLSIKTNGVKNLYYFNKGGVMQTGWQYINKKYYYFDTKTGAAYTGKQKIGDYTFNFSSKGVWDGKVYKGTKNVTSKVDIYKLTGVGKKTTTKTADNTATDKTTNTQNTEKTETATNEVVYPNPYIAEPGTPDTVIIAGDEFSTSLTTLLINKPNVTDKDLENLKYMKNLKILAIVPGCCKGDVGGIGVLYDISNITELEYKYDPSYSVPDRRKYEFTRSWRNLTIGITNLDFCAYMPDLKILQVAYADKLTDISGLKKLQNLQDLQLYNCTALKDLHAIDSTPIGTKRDGVLGGMGILIGFSDNVKYAFTDIYFGNRRTYGAHGIWVRPASERVWQWTSGTQYDDTMPQSVLQANLIGNSYGEVNLKHVSWRGGKKVVDNWSK